MMKIGIVGSGMIVNDCLEAVKDLPEITCSGLCVRPHSKDKGNRLAEKYGIPELYTDYKTFLKRGKMDFVYIGLINSVHYEYAKQALLSGHHVIVEKPFTVTVAEALDLIQLAKEKERFLFEAITTIYLPNFLYVKHHLSCIGEIKLVQCNFSQYSSRYDKYLQGDIAPAFDPSLCGGALYDLNVYNIYFTAALFGVPKEVRYNSNRGHNGVDTSGIVTLQYDSMQAVLSAAKDSGSRNFAMIQGTKGYLEVESQVSLCSGVKAVWNGEEKRYQENIYEQRMQHEWIAIQEMYEKKDLQTCYKNLKLAADVMRILEQARQWD